MMLWGCFNTEVTRSTCMGSTTLVGWSHSKFVMLQTRYTPVFNYVVYSNKNKKIFIVFTRGRFYLRKIFFAATIDGTYFSETFDEKVLAIHSSLTCLLRDFNFSNTFIIRAAEFSFFTGKYFWDRKEGWLFSWKGVDRCHVGRWENYIMWNTSGEVASKFHFCAMFMSLFLKKLTFLTPWYTDLCVPGGKK